MEVRNTGVGALARWVLQVALEFFGRCCFLEGGVVKGLGLGGVTKGLAWKITLGEVPNGLLRFVVVMTFVCLRSKIVFCVKTFLAPKQCAEAKALIPL